MAANNTGHEHRSRVFRAQLPVTVTGSGIHSPTVLVDSSNSTVYLMWISYNDNKIYIATVLNGGLSLSTPIGFDAGGVDLITGSSDVSVLARSLLHVRYNSVDHSIGVVWHRRETFTGFVRGLRHDAHGEHHDIWTWYDTVNSRMVWNTGDVNINYGQGTSGGTTRCSRKSGLPRETLVNLPHSLMKQVLALLLVAAPILAQDLVCARQQGDARGAFERALVLSKSLDDDGAGRVAELARELAADSGDRGAEALAMTIDTTVALRRNDLPAAARLACEALDVAQSTDEPAVLSRAWLTLAEVLRVRAAGPLVPGHTHVECLQNALALAERAGDLQLEFAALMRLGDAANVADDYLTSRGYFDRAIVIARQLDDPSDECEVEIDLALLYMSQHEQVRGMFHQRQAVKLAEENHLPAYPRAMLGLGFAIVNEQQTYDEARAIFNKVLPRDEHGNYIATPAIPRTWLGFGLTGLAGVEMNTGHLEEAECLLRQSDAIFSSALYQVSSVYELVAMYIRRHDYLTGLRLAMESVNAPQTRPTNLAKALMRAARASRGLKDTRRGTALIREAIDIREEIDRGAAGDEQQHVRIAEWCADYYEVAAELALDSGDVPQALTLVEQGRAGVLTGILENGRPDALAKVDEADRHEQRRRERELAQIRIALDASRAEHRAERAVKLDEQLRDARQSYETFVDTIRTRSQRRLSSRRRLDTAQLASMLDRLPRGMVAIEFVIDDDDQLHAFVVRRDPTRRIVCRTTQIERKPLEDRINRFVNAITNRDLDYRESARDVYELLIRPIEKELSGAKALLIVPDEVLWRVPFCALVDANGHFFIERAPIVYAPSITAYATMMHLAPRHAPRAFFGVANPSLTTHDALPDANEEIDAVQALYGARNSKVLEGSAATESSTRAELGKASIIHFATHALLDDAHPMYSRLLLGRDPRANDDGSLEAWEIAQLHLNADLIILSACNTARGSISHGEGVVGMVWAFFVAGARSTVATQWSVASGSTAKLMIDFHRSLRRGDHDPALAKAQALRDAQLQLLHKAPDTHPFGWAGFALYGDASYRLSTHPAFVF